MTTAGSPHAAPFQEPATSNAVVFDHVSFAFDEHVVLREVSFTIPTGSTRIVLGASGSGKSVMLKLVLGLFRPDAGRIVVNGRRIDTHDRAPASGDPG